MVRAQLTRCQIEAQFGFDSPGWNQSDNSLCSAVIWPRLNIFDILYIYTLLKENLKLFRRKVYKLFYLFFIRISTLCTIMKYACMHGQIHAISVNKGLSDSSIKVLFLLTNEIGLVICARSMACIVLQIKSNMIDLINNF